ncbi:MAG: glutamine synthetase, partial [Desulfonatronovibrionaceae bacterium]
PACNLYLAFASMLAAGLKGIDSGYDLPAPVEEDIFEMNVEERGKHGIKSLPGSLFEATEELASSQVIKEALGDHIFSKFIENKRIEWDNYRIQITEYEICKYLPVL